MEYQENVSGSLRDDSLQLNNKVICQNIWFRSLSFKPSKEVNGGELITVPDMSLSVRDILDRFTRGTIDLSSLNRSYSDSEDEDFDSPELTDFEDPVDVYEAKKQYSSRIARLNAALDSYKAKNIESGKTDSTSNDGVV